MDTAAIQEAVRQGRWGLTIHASVRALQRFLSDQDIRAVLLSAEILEDYTEDQRGASALVLGHTGTGRAVHVVCAFNAAGDLVLITVYIPEPPRWIDERTRRS